VLAISGTSSVDRITLDFTALDSVGVDLGEGVQRFAAGTVRSVSLDLGSGDDDLRTVSGGALVDLPVMVRSGAGNDRALGGAANDTIDGGTGEDFLLGGAGSDLVVGGQGADFVNGGVGTDTELLGSGDDTAGWDPGEGNDVVLGGLGRDTLAFNGSDATERMSLTADGANAVFLRSPGSIRMDLVGVERLDLATLGGADAVTVGDLTGTGLTEAAIDLASSTGAGDQANDTVTVLGSDRADDVAVTAAAGAVDVAGLAARTVVTGSESADHLEIDTRGGDDRLVVDPAVDALITVVADLGVGQL
jgi:Ca2+-binding RTX toxin-like protein